MRDRLPRIAVLGASGLIGQAVASTLMADGFPVVALARRFNRAQSAAFSPAAIEAPLVDLHAGRLQLLLADCGADIVLNCVGVLQSGPRGTTGDAHVGFVTRLLEAMGGLQKPCLLLHLSVPGEADGDPTPFSTSKRRAERLIASGPVPFVILRPGFVIAPAAFGGSALVRALAVWPIRLPDREESARFAVTAVGDISRTVAKVARRWGAGEHGWHALWDVMEREPSSVGEVVAHFRHALGGPCPRLRFPSWALSLGSLAGDVAARLGWSLPVRSTALAEMRRGVEGDPRSWISETGLEPLPLEAVIAGLSATVQEKWFARLYLLKPLIVGSLALFWVASGMIALTVSFEAAAAVLTGAGFSLPFAQAVTVASSMADIAVGAGIAVRRSCRAALLAGIALSLFYMAAAALVTPALWIEPLGALVKTGPAIVLMLVALAILDER